MDEQWRCERCGSGEKSSYGRLCRRCYRTVWRSRLLANGWRCSQCGRSDSPPRTTKMCIRCSRTKYFSNNAERRARRNIHTRRLRGGQKFAIIEALGGCCACCGETALEFLTIDHINGDGAEHRRQLGANRSSGRANSDYVYRDIIRQGCPRDKYRVLCFNCNCSIGFWGYCAHHRPHDRKYPYVLGLEPVLE